MEPLKAIDPRTWTRPEFKKNMQKVMTLASIAASWTPTPKDDDFIQLFSHLVEDQEHFDKLCDILGIPA